VPDSTRVANYRSGDLFLFAQYDLIQPQGFLAWALEDFCRQIAEARCIDIEPPSKVSNGSAVAVAWI